MEELLLPDDRLPYKQIHVLRTHRFLHSPPQWPKDCGSAKADQEALYPVASQILHLQMLDFHLCSSVLCRPVHRPPSCFQQTEVLFSLHGKELHFFQNVSGCQIPLVPDMQCLWDNGLHMVLPHELQIPAFFQVLFHFLVPWPSYWASLSDKTSQNFPDVSLHLLLQDLPCQSQRSRAASACRHHEASGLLPSVRKKNKSLRLVSRHPGQGRLQNWLHALRQFQRQIICPKKLFQKPSVRFPPSLPL